MKAFVTGATGLLGGAVVRELVRQGWEVRALCRSPRKASFEGPVEVVPGDLDDVAGFAPALDGCRAVVHCAAFFREYYQPGNHVEIMHRLNVTATGQVLREAALRGVERAVHVSTSGLIGPGGTEDSPPDPEALRNLYFASKLAAEKEVAAVVQETGLHVAQALPGWMFGPHDTAPTNSGQLVADFLARRLPGIPPGGSSIADSRDVAAGIVRLLEAGRPERYILGGRHASLEDVLRTLARVSGVAAPSLKLPYPVVLAAAYVEEFKARITGRPALMNPAGVRTLQLDHRLDSSKAERELGVTFRPLEETLRDCVEWRAAAAPTSPPAPGSR